MQPIAVMNAPSFPAVDGMPAGTAGWLPGSLFMTRGLGSSFKGGANAHATLAADQRGY
jgi:hypothetical protein